MPFTHYALDNFVAQNLSKFTAPEMQSMAAKHPDHKIWITNFLLSSIFTTPLTQHGTALAYAILRRATAALEEYDEACLALHELPSSKILTYFKVQRKIEYAIALAYQAFNTARCASKIRLFEQSDGTLLQRLNMIYNRSRYVDVQNLPPGQLHAVWLQNDGIHSWGGETDTADVSLTFGEFEEVLGELAYMADQIAKGKRPEADTAEGICQS